MKWQQYCIFVMTLHAKRPAICLGLLILFHLFFQAFSVEADNIFAPVFITIPQKQTGSTPAAPVTVNPYDIAHIPLSKDQRRAFDDLKVLLSNKSLSATEAYSACSNFFSLMKGQQPGLGQIDYQQIDDLLVQDQDKSLAPLIKGFYNRELAWAWRGCNYFDKLQNIQINLFNEKLAVAESALKEAWALNSDQVLIANEMLCVELGQGRGRDTMELWFQRAMNLDTNNYWACSEKLLYLEPKWYGSTRDMLAFGRQCFESVSWGGKVPLILAVAYRSIAESYLPDSMKKTYWKQPSVWRDFSAAYEKYLASHPDDLRAHQFYAHYAYLGQHWSVLNEQLPLMSSPDYTIFGGKAAFDEMIRVAKDHVDQQ